MKDQVDALHEAGISAAYINSTMTTDEYQMTMEATIRGEYSLLYIAPERLDSPSFTNRLQLMNVSMVAIDEAHCISQWGHDFRPSYRNIRNMISLFHEKPVVLALTATATPAVREDICAQLGITEENTVMTGFERAKLDFFSCERAEPRKVCERLCEEE